MERSKKSRAYFISIDRNILIAIKIVDDLIKTKITVVFDFSDMKNKSEQYVMDNVQ